MNHFRQRQFFVTTIWVIAALLLILFQGDSVLALNVNISVAPDKAFYHPGDTVALMVQADSGAQVQATIRYLSETVATLNAPLEHGAARLTWTPPAETLRGYGVDVQLLDGKGVVLATTSSAFDVLDRWIQAPRYGFLSDFRPGRTDIDATMALNARYHVNGLQFYDWQYRHETLLPPAGMEPYTDVLGRTHSLNTVNRLITAAHDYNIAAMPYTAIYGASYAFYQQHPDWALFDPRGQAYDFAGFLKIMDPAPGSPWATHLLGEYANVLENTAFDGIHIDQYGAPMHGFDANKQMVKMETAFPAFIDQTAALVHRLRGDAGATIFNLVRNWPVKTVALSDEDVIYIEVWDPYRSFMDLPRLISEAQRLGGGKPVILAAYIPPEQRINVQLANALIFASGGYHLELGEPKAMLADPYFSQFGLMDEQMQQVERRYYDFLVRYENVLALHTSDATKDRAGALSIAGVETKSLRSQDRVAVIVRQGDGFETFSLVNLLGVDGSYWNEPLTHAPTLQHDLAVRLSIPAGKTVARVWLASPDGTDLQAKPVDFTSDGTAIHLKVPQLDYWTMLVVEYAS